MKSSPQSEFLKWTPKNQNGTIEQVDIEVEPKWKKIDWSVKRSIEMKTLTDSLSTFHFNGLFYSGFISMSGFKRSHFQFWGFWNVLISNSLITKCLVSQKVIQINKKQCRKSIFYFIPKLKWQTHKHKHTHTNIS